jgi:hypothetical protein
MFDPVRVCQILNEEAVDYTVIGGVAAAAHGSSLTTRDIDVMPSTGLENLDRLASELTQIHARIRTEGNPVPIRLDGVDVTTDCGDVDVVFDTWGIDGGFPAWNRGAVLLEIGDGVTIQVASLDDVIASKRAADRPKDRAALPYLESLRDEAGH